MGARVIYTAKNGQRLHGEVVGPDQRYFPSPREVFVSLPTTGFTLLIPITKLTLAGDAP
jgi:hypothetical protein